MFFNLSKLRISNYVLFYVFGVSYFVFDLIHFLKMFLLLNISDIAPIIKNISSHRVIECKGPTNTRVYSVAVYFQNKRLAVGSGHRYANQFLFIE